MPRHLVEALDHRDRRFADADDADFVRFDDADVVAPAQHGGDAVALIQPAVPPPTMTMFLIGWFCMRFLLPKKKQPRRARGSRGCGQAEAMLRTCSSAPNW
jgi:hypothetical protein